MGRGPGPPASAAPLREASGSLGPRPLSAQARTRHDLPTHLSLVTYPCGFHRTPFRPTDRHAGSPILWPQSWDWVSGQAELVINHYLASGGTYSFDSCVCV